MIPDYDQNEDYDKYADFHAVFTIQMGELIHDGLIDFNDGTWGTLPDGKEIEWYSDEQRERFWSKFEYYYFWREIGELPFMRWKWDLLTKISMLMPKYNFVYKLIDDGIDPLQVEDVYGKSRDMYSDFPQTMLSGNQDYASTGKDTEYENVREGNFIDTVFKIYNEYKDPDMALVQELDDCFYCVLTSNVSGF